MTRLQHLRQHLRDRISDLSLYLNDEGTWARCPFCGSFAVHPYGHRPHDYSIDKTVLECLDCSAPILSPKSCKGCV